MSLKKKNSGEDWVITNIENWKVIPTKQLFYEVADRVDDADETELLSVSEYYGITPRIDVVETGDYVTRAVTLKGYKQCQINDLVMNIMLAWKRALGISNYSGVVSPAYCVFRPKCCVYPRYYHHLYRTDLYTTLFRRFSTGIINSRLRLYPEVFLSLPSIFPPYIEQKRIANYLDRQINYIDSFIVLQEEAIVELQAYKQSIITEAVTKGLNSNVPMKDSGVEWVGVVPLAWQITKCGNLFEIVLGKMLQPNRRDNNDTLENYLSAINMGNNAIKYEPIKQMWFNAKEKETFRLHNGDLLVVEGGDVASSDVVSELPGEMFFQNSLLRARNKHADSDVRFLRYWLMAAKSSGFIELICNKATIMHFTRTKFTELLIAHIPTAEEQTRIIDFLDENCRKIDKLISLKTEKIDALNEYKQSLIYECVTGKRDCRPQGERT